MQENKRGSDVYCWPNERIWFWMALTELNLPSLGGDEPGRWDAKGEALMADWALSAKEARKLGTGMGNKGGDERRSGGL